MSVKFKATLPSARKATRNEVVLDSLSLSVSGEADASFSRRRVRVQIQNSAPFFFRHPERSEGSRRAFQRPSSATHTSAVSERQRLINSAPLHFPKWKIKMSL